MPQGVHAVFGFHDRVTIIVLFDRIWLDHAHVALDALLELNGEWHDRQRTAGIIDPNSGGNTVYVSPGLRLTVENWSSYVLVGVPVVNDLNGIQAAPSWRLMGGVSVVLGP